MGRILRGWRAWYTDRRVYCSVAWKPAEIPADGLLVLCEYEVEAWRPGRPYRRILTGADWYWWAPALGRWERKPSEAWGSHRPPPCGVPAELLKRGAGASDEEFRRVSALAMDAVTWP